MAHVKQFSDTVPHTERASLTTEIESYQHVPRASAAHAVHLQRASAQHPRYTKQAAAKLQRAYGNRAVAQAVQVTNTMPLVVQPKLVVTPAGDQYEQEADRVADQVVNQISSGAVQHTFMPGARRGNDQPAQVMRQASSGMGAPSEIGVDARVEAGIQRARGGGQPLPQATRTAMEHSFGADFGGVRIHIDVQANDLNQSLSARAFTTGRDIFFRQGEYNPISAAGRRLLAHELTHVVQQRGARDTALRSGYTQETDRLGSPIIQRAGIPSVGDFKRNTHKFFRGKLSAVDEALETYQSQKNEHNRLMLIVVLRDYIRKAKSQQRRNVAQSLLEKVLQDQSNAQIVNQFQQGDKLFGLSYARNPIIKKVESANANLKWTNQDRVNNQFMGTQYDPSGKDFLQILQERGFQEALIWSTYTSQGRANPLPSGVQEFKDYIERHPRYDPQNIADLANRDKRVNQADKAGLEFWTGQGHTIFFILDGITMSKVTSARTTKEKSFTGRELRKLYRDRDQAYVKKVKFFRAGFEISPPWDSQIVDSDTKKTWQQLWQEYGLYRAGKIALAPANYDAQGHRI